VKNDTESRGYNERLKPGQTEANYRPNRGEMERFLDSDAYQKMLSGDGSEHQRFAENPAAYLDAALQTPGDQAAALRTTAAAMPAYSPAQYARPCGPDRYARREGSQKYNRRTCEEAFKLATTDPAILRLKPEERYEAALRRIVDEI
jgi:hypothetical protein